jgi:hypothetical protein
MKKKVLILFFIPVFLLSQNYPGLGSWNILNIRKNINKNYSLWIETQFRSLEFYDKFHYNEIKGGVTYRINENLNFSLNGGKYRTYTFGGNFENPITNNEIRTWQEINYRNNYERVINDQRVRIEQRFTNNYINRYRYRNSIILPINHSKMSEHTSFLNVSDEIFFSDYKPYFIRNRFYVGGGYRFKKETIQIGYLKQFEQKTNLEWVKNYIQVQFLINI